MKYSKLLIFTLILSQFSSSADAAGGGTRKHTSPAASEILESLATYAKSVRNVMYENVDGVATAIPVADISAGNLKVELLMDLTASPRKVKINLAGASGAGDLLDTSSSNELGSRLKVIGAVAYPASSATLATVADWRAAPEVQSILTQVDAVLSYCDTKINSLTKEWWFEVVPMHLYCHALNRQNLISYRKLIDMDGSAPTDTYIMPSTDFVWTRNHIVAELAAGAVIYHAHSKISAEPSYVKNKARCFPVGRPMVETVLASSGMTFVQTGGVGSDVSLAKVDANRLPEPNYALGAADQYYNDEKQLVFNNVPAGVTATTAPSFKIENTSYKTFQFDSQGVLHFKFRLRDIHRPGVSPATCQWFCQNLQQIKDKKSTKQPS